MCFGPRPWRVSQTIQRTFKSILYLTGSQCRDWGTGVMCSFFLVFVGKEQVNADVCYKSALGSWKTSKTLYECSWFFLLPKLITCNILCGFEKWHIQYDCTLSRCSSGRMIFSSTKDHHKSMWLFSGPCIGTETAWDWLCLYCSLVCKWHIDDDVLDWICSSHRRKVLTGFKVEGVL